MAGIYLHIPFCRKKCSYCDFYSVVRPTLVPDFTKAIRKELKQNNSAEPIHSIYFGGGTPSILESKDLDNILNDIHETFSVSDKAEITLEANPEDISESKLIDWKQAGINRLSIGIQSTNDDILKQLKRNHTAKDALHCLELSIQKGFDNLSADLIYGLPGLSVEQWETSLNQLLDSGITHLSAYHLGLEPGTLMHKQVENRIIQLPNEDISLAQFQMLFEKTESKGFPWYEISNFAKPGYHSKHNSSYWDGSPYFGFGPSAHSYDGKNTRYWNQPNIKAYIENPTSLRESETLSTLDKVNDFLITRLRTRKGISLIQLKNDFPSLEIEQLEQKFNQLIDSDLMQHVDMLYSLKQEALFVSDAILKDILYI